MAQTKNIDQGRWSEFLSMFSNDKVVSLEVIDRNGSKSILAFES